MPAPKPKSALDLEFERAVVYFRRHRAVTKEEWDALDEGARRRAVRIASIAHRGVLNDVWQALEEDVRKGGDFRAFKTQIADKLRKKYGGEVAIPAHLETIYRNETQRAFQFGHVTAALSPAVRSRRPFWQFKAIDDSRTTTICRECDGTIAEANGSWWQHHMPPLHHRCRSTFVTLTPEAAGRAGGVTNTPPQGTGTPGFGRIPDVGDIDDLERQKAAQLPRELQPKREPPVPDGPPGRPRRPGAYEPQPLELPLEPSRMAPPDEPKAPPTPAPVGDPMGEPVGKPVGEPVFDPPPADKPKRVKGPKGGTRKPRTAIERSVPVATGRDRWVPGEVRSDAPEVVSTDAVPWRIGDEVTAPGRLVVRAGARIPEAHESLLDSRLLAQGNDVTRLPDEDDADTGVVFSSGEKRPDREINGQVVELRSVFNSGGLGRALKQKAKRQQAQLLILDAAEAGVTRVEALEEVVKRATALGASFRFVRIIGRDFDVTIEFPIDATKS